MGKEIFSNFLRAFVDYFFDCANERADWNGKIALVTPTAHGRAGVFNEQDCLYTLYLRGNENGQAVSRKRIISVADACYNPYVPEDWKKIKEIAVSDDLEYMISNTTEAGITYDPSCLPDDEPPASFPAKVAVLLHERFLINRGSSSFPANLLMITEKNSGTMSCSMHATGVLAKSL